MTHLHVFYDLHFILLISINWLFILKVILGCGGLHGHKIHCGFNLLLQSLADDVTRVPKIIINFILVFNTFYFNQHFMALFIFGHKGTHRSL